MRLLLLILLAAVPARAGIFNDFFPGARGMGMGMAVTAVPEGPFAMFYNPAGPANTPYTQAAVDLGRFSSPVGPMSFASIAYLRPYEPIPTATMGWAYMAQRQKNSGDKDEMLFSFSREYKVPRLPVSRPIKVGGNFKVVNIEQGPGAGFGAGFDGGVLLRTNMGMSGAFTLKDMTTNVGVPRPTLSLGTAYTWRKWLTLAGDLRVRSNLTEFFPGIEASFFQGLLRGRVGRGFPLDGSDHVALGLGLDYSPVVIDFAMTIPWAGIYREAGAYQASFTYRFGAPPFSGSFIGNAAAEAESLNSRILELEEKKKNLDREAQTSDSNRTAIQGEYKVLENRVRELQEEYRALQNKKDETEYELKVLQLRVPKPPPPPPPPPKPKPKPAPVWPRPHTVKPGETLRSIAQQIYGDAGLWEQIYLSNQDKVERGLPVEGAVLLVPEPKR